LGLVSHVRKAHLRSFDKVINPMFRLNHSSSIVIESIVVKIWWFIQLLKKFNNIRCRNKNIHLQLTKKCISQKNIDKNYVEPTLNL
jgi:hypothetical protein